MIRNFKNKDFLLGFMTCLCLILVLNTFNCGRSLSRVGLGDQTLDLPKDFEEMISVSFHKDRNGDTVKDMTYKATDGNYRSVEYKDKLWKLGGSIRWEKKE
ncbi:MAG: hypothetical protein AAF518_20370 [Spirochaetota bacterium]